jgi:pyridinium-3,5-biscarboxylic acid mononucleotide synthase
VTEIRWDGEREDRTSIPEVAFGPGKTIAHLRAIFSEGSGLRMATRLSDDQMNALGDLAVIHSDARMAVRSARPLLGGPPVAVLTAGTADIPVAREAITTLNALGVPTISYFDVGVAGIHRLYAVLPDIQSAAVCIVVAGMDGALPAVVTGLVRAPVIGVPTSIGAGAGREGMTALNTMLASCSPGLAVVNIDNGFGAACMAIKIIGAGAKLRADEILPKSS